jgi:hypothetical protein
VRAARPKISGLPEVFRFHDLRHASAETTLDAYGRLWSDSDESVRAAIGAVLAARADSSGTATAPEG